MTDVDPQPPDLPRVRGRLPFEEKPFGAAMQHGQVLLFAVLAIGLTGLALYMGAAARHPLTSPYVAAPAIGALWFGLRLFMILGSRK